jgi:hypothetical protein
MRAIFATCSGLLLVLVLVSGCANTDEELRDALRAERDRGLSIVTRREIAAEPPRSPSRAVLELWRAVQYRDAQAGMVRLAPPPPKNLRFRFEQFLVGSGANAFAVLKPRIADVQRRGRVAVVRTEIVHTKRFGRLVERELAATVRLELVKAGGLWKLRWGPAPSERGGDSPRPEGGADLRPAEVAALQWYRALGDRDAAAVIDGLSDSARRPLDEDLARRQIAWSLGRWAGETVATVLYSERRAGTTTVFMRIQGGQRIGPTLINRRTLMLALPIVSDDGRRLVDDSAWLRFQVDAHAAATRAAGGAPKEGADASGPG